MGANQENDLFEVEMKEHEKFSPSFKYIIGNKSVEGNQNDIEDASSSDGEGEE
jgi:hypothetical protein